MLKPSAEGRLTLEKKLAELGLKRSSYRALMLELPDLVVHAEAIARATADALDDPNAVTPEEEAALAEIARLLQVDGGATWKRVLESLRTQRPPGLAVG